MNITLELTKDTADQLREILTTNLRSLVYQEACIKDAIEGHITNEGKDKTKHLTDEQYNNLLEYLKVIAPQRMLLADFLSKIIEQLTVVPQILESTIIPAQNRNKLDAKLEREAWVDSVLQDLTENE